MTQQLPAPAADRAVRILNAFKASPHEYGVSELSQLLGLHKSSVHAILTVLAHHGFVQRDPQTRRYRLGYALLELATYIPRAELPFLAQLSLNRLRDEIGETALLGVYIDGHATLLARAESHHLMRISAPSGFRLPLDAGCFGKLYLASLEPATLDALLETFSLRRYTERTILDLAALRRDLEQVRACRLATDNEEYLEGVRAVAAPITYGGTLLAAIAVVGLSSRLDLGRFARAGEQVAAAAAHVEQQLRRMYQGGKQL